MSKIFADFIKEQFLFDSHIHLNTEEYDDKLKDLVKRAEESGVKASIDMSVDVDSAVKSLELAKKFSGKIYSAIGIDPEVYIPGSELNNENFDVDISLDFIDKLITDSIEFVAMIGETGVDNHWIKQNEDLSDDQRDEIIAKQI